MNIDVIYESDDVVVVDKPSGIAVHRDDHIHKETLSEWFLAHCPDSAGVGEAMTLASGKVIERPGVVHRLDGETSGVLILAKTEKAFRHFKDQFHNRTAEKEYRAFVYGTLKETGGVIERPIGRSASDFRLRSAQRGARGTLRDALTRWELIVQNDEHAYLAVFPKTGRTHQIRAHMKAINHPVVCDRLYAPKRPCALGFERLALHAHTLSISLPSGERKTFQSPLPEEFLKAEKRLSG